MAKKLAKKFTVEVTVPEGKVAGDTFEVEVETPMVESPGRGRTGQLAGIKVEDMTDDELKREIINAGSVLFKAKKKTDDPTVIEPKQARLDAAKAERDKRNAAKAAAVAESTATATDADETADDTNADDTVYDEETAAEV